MALKRSGDIDELCYPYIYEQGELCDFEVITDELCSQVGDILCCLDVEYQDPFIDLQQLQPMMFHLNGSIRGKQAIHEKDIVWLKQRYRHYRNLTQSNVSGFLLPQGDVAAMKCYLARSNAKKAIRIMVKLDQQGVVVADELHRFCNLLCNFFFVLAVYINQLKGIREKPFTSLSYPQKDAGR